MGAVCSAIEFRYIEPHVKAVSNELGDMPVSSKNHKVQSVRDVLKIMHDWPKTLADIGIHSSTADKVTKARVAAWTNLLTEWKAVGKEWDATYPERKSIDIPFTDPKSKDKVREFLAKLQTRFDGKIDEDTSELLGMQWERNFENRTSKLHQAAYIEKMLKSFGFWNYHKPPRTPMPAGTRLIPSCMHAAEHCLKYIAGTPTEGIRYGRDNTPLHEERGPHQLWGFVDADFASDSETRRSHTGYCLFLNGGPISWKSTRQQSVSLSTAEAEWYAASEAGKEIVYLRSILDDFGQQQHGPTKLYEDSRAVICMAENPVNRKASRHIDTRRYWIGEAVAAKVIKLLPCTTQKMVADALTKSLPLATFEKHRRAMLGECNAPYAVHFCYVS